MHAGRVQLMQRSSQDGAVDGLQGNGRVFRVFAAACGVAAAPCCLPIARLHLGLGLLLLLLCGALFLKHSSNDCKQVTVSALRFDVAHPDCKRCTRFKRFANGADGCVSQHEQSDVLRE